MPRNRLGHLDYGIMQAKPWFKASKKNIKKSIYVKIDAFNSIKKYLERKQGLFPAFDLI